MTPKSVVFHHSRTKQVACMLELQGSKADVYEKQHPTGESQSEERHGVSSAANYVSGTIKCKLTFMSRRLQGVILFCLNFLTYS